MLFLPHARGGVSVGDIMPKKQGPPPSQLGVLDHLHHLEMATMRPHRLLKSERRRVIAICASPTCSFRFIAKAYEGDYRVTFLAPHDCLVGQPRKNRKIASHLPWEAQQVIANTLLNGSSCIARGVQATCKEIAGVDIGVRQIKRLRKANVTNESELLAKLQILPAALHQIQMQLPAAMGILQTDKLHPQFHTAATKAFREYALRSGIECDFPLSEEKSIQSLFFGESDLVRHLEGEISHQIYTVDAAHLNKPTVGYDCIVMLVTRRLGNGRIIVPAWALTVLSESESTWATFFNFCIKLGLGLNDPKAVIVSDMGKGLVNSCPQQAWSGSS